MNKKTLKDLFEDLVKSLSEQKLVTEEKSNDMISSFAKKFDEVKEEIYQEAIENATEKAEVDYGKKLEEILAKLDDKHKEEIKKCIDEIEIKHGTQALEMIKSSLAKQDEEYGVKLENAIEKIDTDASEKLKTAVEVVNKKRDEEAENDDEEATKKLQAVKEYYETKYMDVITEKLDKYFDAYLEETQPKEIVLDAAKLSRLEKSIEAIKEILMISDDFVQKEVKEAVVEAKSIIEEKDAKINELMLKIAESKRSEKIKEAKSFLESKIANASPKLRAFLEVTFKNVTSKDEIESKIDEAIEQFKKDETSIKESLVAEAKEKSIKPATIITENLIQNLNTNPLMDQYIKILSKTK